MLLLTAARGSGHDDLGHFDKHGTFRKKEEEEETIIPSLYSYRHRKASTSLEVGKPDGQGAGRAGLRSIQVLAELLMITVQTRDIKIDFH